MSLDDYLDRNVLLTGALYLMIAWAVVSCGWQVSRVLDVDGRIAIHNRIQQVDPLTYGMASSHGGTPQYWLEQGKARFDVEAARGAWALFTFWLAAIIARRRKTAMRWRSVIGFLMLVTFVNALSAPGTLFCQQHVSLGWLTQRAIFSVWTLLWFLPALMLALVQVIRLYRNRAQAVSRLRDQVDGFANSDACCWLALVCVLGPVVIPMAFFAHSVVHRADPVGFDPAHFGWFERYLGIGRDVGDYLLEDRIVLCGEEDHEFQWDLPVDYGKLDIGAEAHQWSPGTTLGLEYWGPRRGMSKQSNHYAVLFRAGELVVRNPESKGVEHREPVTGWDKLKYCGSHRFTFIWQPNTVALLIDGKQVAVYRGRLVPTRSLRVRFNAGSGDVLEVYRFVLGHKRAMAAD